MGLVRLEALVDTINKVVRVWLFGGFGVLAFRLREGFFHFVCFFRLLFPPLKCTSREWLGASAGAGHTVCSNHALLPSPIGRERVWVMETWHGRGRGGVVGGNKPKGERSSQKGDGGRLSGGGSGWVRMEGWERTGGSGGGGRDAVGAHAKTRSTQWEAPVHEEEEQEAQQKRTAAEKGQRKEVAIAAAAA